MTPASIHVVMVMRRDTEQGGGRGSSDIPFRRSNGLVWEFAYVREGGDAFCTDRSVHIHYTHGIPHILSIERCDCILGEKLRPIEGSIPDTVLF